MSRFSQSEAESLGWRFAHSSEERREAVERGRIQITPASVRAEKNLSGVGMINEEAETIGLLLERIAAYEAHLKQKQIVQTPVAVNEGEIPTIILPAGDEPGDTVGEDTGIPIRTVTLPGGERITEEELTARSKQDALVIDGKMVFTGPRPAMTEAEEERAAASAQAENDRVDGVDDLGRRESIFIDRSQTVTDLPGGATGSAFVVLEGEDPDTISESRQEAKADDEANKPLVAALPVAEQAQADAEAEEPDETEESGEEAHETSQEESVNEEHEVGQVEGHDQDHNDGQGGVDVPGTGTVEQADGGEPA